MRGVISAELLAAAVEDDSAPPVGSGCRDTRCQDGVTWCPDCNGHGKVNPKGKKYRVSCQEIPAWAKPHDKCNGTGLSICGCVEFDEVTAAALVGVPVPDAAVA